MGIIFLVIWLVIFAVIAAILGVIGVAVVYPFLSKKARKRKMLLTFLTPIVGIASYVGSSVIAMIIISELLNVDIGFGDSWKAPLPNGYQLISVDVPDNGSIYKDDDHHAESIDGVQQIKVIGDSVIGLSGNKYFLLDTKIHKVTYYPSALELQKRVGKTNISLISNDDYYWAVREKAYIIGGIICLLFTLSVLFIMWKVCLSFHFRVQSKFKVLGILPLLAFIVACSEGSHQEVPRDGVIRATNEFSIKLLKQLAVQNVDKGIMFSPLGIVYSLEMMSNGADGETKQLLQHTLGLDSFQLSDVNAVSSLMMTTHGMGGVEKAGANKASLNTSNVFRYNNQHKIKPDFLQTISRDYSAKSQPVEGLESRAAELVNTLIFNGAWEEEFWTNHTKPDTFYITKDEYRIVDMMYQTDKKEHLRYTQSADYAVLSMPYIGSFTMDVLLPNEDKTVEDVLNGLTMENYNKSIKSLMEYGVIEVCFPKFRSKSQIDIKPALKAMGLGAIFTDSANFSLIDDEPIALENIKQDIEFDIDEEGTHVEAVTTSALISLGESSNPDKAVFRANRPFIYLIHDGFGTICFAGVYRGGK